MPEDDLGSPDTPPPERLARPESSARVRLALHRLAGDAGAPALVVVAHATGLHGRAYLPLARALREVEVVGPDLRGHGEATSPQPLEYSWAGFADDLLVVLETLGRLGLRRAGRPLFGFGHSMGGACLLMAEQRLPGTFDALYCFEPIVFPEPQAQPTDSPMVERARRRRSEFPSLLAAYRNFAAKPPLSVLHPDALRAYVRYGFAPTAKGTVELECRGEEEAEIYRMSSVHRTFERLDEVACPVVVAHGSRSASPAAAFAEPVARRLRRGTAESFPELGHFGPLQDPALVAASMQRLFARVCRQRGPAAGAPVSS
jgi:pimeloyl-ACP methyl ester carboxylesterase